MALRLKSSPRVNQEFVMIVRVSPSPSRHRTASRGRVKKHVGWGPETAAYIHPQRPAGDGTALWICLFQNSSYRTSTTSHRCLLPQPRSFESFELGDIQSQRLSFVSLEDKIYEIEDLCPGYLPFISAPAKTEA